MKDRVQHLLQIQSKEGLPPFGALLVHGPVYYVGLAAEGFDQFGGVDCLKPAQILMLHLRRLLISFLLLPASCLAIARSSLIPETVGLVNGNRRSPKYRSSGRLPSGKSIPWHRKRERVWLVCEHRTSPEGVGRAFGNLYCCRPSFQFARFVR